MFGGGLSVLVQAQLEDFLEGIQPTSGFSAGTKRKKALNRFSQFYFTEQPELTEAQVALVLAGDHYDFEDGDDTRVVIKKNKRTGLMHLCGLIRRKKEQGKKVLTQSATLAIGILDEIINGRTELPSALLFRQVFEKMTLALLETMNLDLHVSSGRSRKQAFRLVHCVLRYHRIQQGESDEIGHLQPIVLEQLLSSEDAHDQYIDWEEDALSESSDSDHAPREWNHVVIAENSDDEEESDMKVAKTLLASVLEKDIIGGSHSSRQTPGALLATLSEGSLLEENSASTTSPSVLLNITEGQVVDPLRLRPGDLRALDVSTQHRMGGGSGSAKHRSMKAQLPPAPPTIAIVKPPPPTSNGGNDDANGESAIDLSRKDSSTMSTGSNEGKSRKLSKGRRFVNFVSRRRNRARSNSNASSGREESPPPSPTASQASMSSSPAQSFSSQRKSLSMKRPTTVEEKENNRDSYDPDVIQKIYSLSRQRSFQSTSSASTGVANSSTQIPKSILPTSDRFDSSLFLYRVHNQTHFGDLMKGLQNLEKDNEDQRGILKNFVQENFDEFVHCRRTIGHIHELMQQETGNDGGGSRTQKVDGALEKALETADGHFVPLLQKRKRIRKLRRAADMLSRLEYLWQLPTHLEKLMGEHRWIEAVIEFSKVGQHLSLLEKDKKGKTQSFYLDAVKDLQQCGETLVKSLVDKLVQPPEFKAHSETITKTTSEALKGNSSDSLVCTEALSLLLELRDHIPTTSKLYSMLDMDGDPFVMLASYQQDHARKQLEELKEPGEKSPYSTLDVPTRFNLAHEMVREYLNIWEDARVCLDPSSQSSGKEHIFDVLNRVKGDTANVVTVASSSAADDDDIYNNGADRSSRRLRRTGSTDLLFDIRKRSAANCTLEDLAERRKASDEMAWKVLYAYLNFVKVMLENHLLIDCTEAMKFYQDVLHVIRRVRTKGALNAAAHGRARQLKKYEQTDDQTKKALVENAEIIHTLEALAKTLVGKRMDMLIEAIRSRFGTLSSSSMNENENGAPPSTTLDRQQSVHAAEDIHDILALYRSEIQRRPPQLRFVNHLIQSILSCLDDVKGLLHGSDGSSLWRDGFLTHLAVEHSKTMAKCIRYLREWIAKRSKVSGSAEIIPMLFADCRYCRTTFVDTMQQLLAEATDPKFKFSVKNSDETLSLQLQRQLQKLEEALMSQYVHQRASGLQKLVQVAMEFDHNMEDWPNPPRSIRSYTLDILLHCVNVVAECAHRVGPDGSRQLLCGLTARLAIIYCNEFASIQEKVGSHPGAILQLHGEIIFLRDVLRKYEDDKATKAFAQLLDALRTMHKTTQQDDVIFKALLDDMQEKSKLLRQSLLVVV